MTNKLLNAQLGTAFTTDPAVALWTFLKNNWSTTTGYTVPAIANIKFDTKFGDMIGYNFVIIENMPVTIKPQILGAGRFRYTDTKRLQIMCEGPSCKDTKWKMERHIEALINGNIQSMITDGIDEILLGEFVEINTTQTDEEISQRKTDRQLTARSRALITLIYDQYQAVA